LVKVQPVEQVTTRRPSRTVVMNNTGNLEKVHTIWCNVTSRQCEMNMIHSLQ